MHIIKPRNSEIYCTRADAIEGLLQDFAVRILRLHSIRRLGLAVSGGADSVALFHLMCPLCREMKITPVILHLNHGLRAESAEEAEFVKSLAESSRLAFQSKTVELSNRTQANQSLEMAARKARLQFYGECIDRHGLDAIATGHHADDLCETLLLRLARGSGIAGLAGMRPLSVIRSNGAAGQRVTVIRPLLNIASSALREWLRQHELAWFDDLSNRDTSIPRNNLRHNVIPWLREHMQADIESRLCLSAATMREDEAVLNEIAEENLASIRYNNSIMLPGLCRLPLAVQRRVLRLWLFENELTAATGFSAVSALLAKSHSPEGSWKLQLTSEVLAESDGNLLSLRGPVKPELLPEIEIIADGTIRWGGYQIQSKRSHGLIADSAGAGIFPASCALDAARLRGRILTVRQRRAGDRIKPTGLQGSRKIKDILIDAKVARDARDALPLITCGSDVVWLPGYRISRDYALSTENSEALHITVSRAADSQD